MELYGDGVDVKEFLTWVLYVIRYIPRSRRRGICHPPYLFVYVIITSDQSLKEIIQLFNGANAPTPRFD